MVVICLLSGNGSRVPFSITSVEYRLADNKPVQVSGSGTSFPRFGANIAFNGTGRLKGRWEVVLPGDPPPSQRDLLTEGTLPLEERGLQRRYTQLERFDIFVQPTGKVFLPGPDPAKFPKGSIGLHQVLLRIEATEESDERSLVNDAFVSSGGVAGFPLPTFRYSIVPKSTQITLLEPTDHDRIATDKPLRFSWQGVEGASGYRLEVRQSGRLIFAAVLGANTTSYIAPPWLKTIQGEALSWKIRSLKPDGSVQLESESRDLQPRVLRSVNPSPIKNGTMKVTSQ